MQPHLLGLENGYFIRFWNFQGVRKHTLIFGQHPKTGLSNADL